ncbi:MAG TPA: hypothetical protein VFF84_13900 [Sphingobium sp.]|nr:hypothetical protein [Sphingobium sp.]
MLYNFPDKAIDFDPYGQPVFEEGCCFLPAKLGRADVRAGITHDALMLVWGKARDDEPPRFIDAFDPALERVRAIIQQKFERAGLDGRGRIVVTDRDLVEQVA